MKEHSIFYWLIWPFAAISFVIVWFFVFIFIHFRYKEIDWLRKWENYVDDPIDGIKEWLHCRRIPFTNYQLNISFLMMNRKTTWDIIRKHKKWENCDPEDLRD